MCSKTIVKREYLVLVFFSRVDGYNQTLLPGWLYAISGLNVRPRDATSVQRYCYERSEQQHISDGLPVVSFACQQILRSRFGWYVREQKKKNFYFFNQSSVLLRRTKKKDNQSSRWTINVTEYEIAFLIYKTK